MASPVVIPPRPTHGVAGEITEEITEVSVRGYLEKHPDQFQGVLKVLGFPPEIATKFSGILFGKFVSWLVSACIHKLGIKSATATMLANTIDDVIKGGVDAFAERARAIVTGHAAPEATHAATAPASTAAGDFTVIRSRAMSGDTANHVHSLEGSLILCLEFRMAKDAWDNKQKALLIKDEAGKGKGKSKDHGGPQVHIKLAAAEEFPTEKLSGTQAKQIGYKECPACTPYTKAAEKAAAQEAKMAHTAHDAAGHPAPAKKEEKPKPIEDWEEKVLAVGRWLAIVFSASLKNGDFGNEMRTVPTMLWTDRAFIIVRKYAKKLNKAVTPDMTLVDLLDIGLPDTLESEDLEAVVMLIKTSGQYHEGLETKVSAVLAQLTGQKKKAEESKKASAADTGIKAAAQRVRDAKKNLADLEEKRAEMNAAAEELEEAKTSGDRTRMTDAGKAFAAAKAAFKVVDPLESAFEDELADAQKEHSEAKKTKDDLLPKEKPHNPWPGRIGIGVGITLALYVIWTAITLASL